MSSTKRDISMNNRVLITGGLGQLGWELSRTKPPKWEVWITDVYEMDITQEEVVAKVFRELRPNIVINAAAYTAVDKAEEEEELAFRVNRDGVINLARVSKEIGSRLVHISTDFVFNGLSGVPYRPEDEPAPLNVYGNSKLAGEKALEKIYPKGSVVIRTAWLYSTHGNNFVKTMLRLFQKSSLLRVVCDQVGTPTWAFNLARFIWFVVDHFDEFSKGRRYHFTDAGVASWYDFAVAIEEETRSWRTHSVEVVPIPSRDYPTKAIRPPFSVLDKESAWKMWNEKPEHWRKALRRMLEELYNSKEWSFG
ncbi:MAG: dTDP-4-dehydrorhamnose reductase [Syntrophobacterales bacterium]|nr:dTDP-4-dehydrorhamnose reductase [Syntrophobacterales bacterium]